MLANPRPLKLLRAKSWPQVADSQVLTFGEHREASHICHKHSNKKQAAVCSYFFKPACQRPDVCQLMGRAETHDHCHRKIRSLSQGSVCGPKTNTEVARWEFDSAPKPPIDLNATFNQVWKKSYPFTFAETCQRWVICTSKIQQALAHL